MTDSRVRASWRSLVVDIGPLRDCPGFRLMFLARVFSVLGLGVTIVAVPVQTYALTKSSLAVSGVSLVLGCALVVSTLIGGVLADRFDRSRMMVLARSVSGLASLVFAVNSATSEELWLIYAAVAIAGIADGMSGTASMAATPALVGRARLPAAGALMAITAQVGAIIGPSFGGLLIAGPGFTISYAITGLMTVLTIVVLLFLPELKPDRDAQSERHPLRALADGFGFVRRSRLISGLLLIDCCAMLFAMPYALFPELAERWLGGGSQTAGLLYAAPGVGALLAAVTSGWVTHVRRPGHVLVGAVIAWGMAIAMLGFATHLAIALILVGFAGLADSISEILRRSLLQQHTPDALQGRVSSLWLAQATVGPSIGNVEAGAAATIAGPRIALVAGGALCMTTAAAVARGFPAMRNATLASSTAEEANVA